MYIIVSSVSSYNSNKADVSNIIPGPPIIFPFHVTRVALVDLTFPLREEDEGRNESILTFPVDPSKNETIIIPPDSSIDNINHQVDEIVTKIVGSTNSKATTRRFIFKDLNVERNRRYFGVAEKMKEVWLEQTKLSEDDNTYYPPYLYLDPHENIVYQVPGYYFGNIPMFLDLSESFLSKHIYGGMVFTPEENTERVKYFSRWTFCRKELGAPFPLQKATKPLSLITAPRLLPQHWDPTLSNDPSFVYKIPKPTETELAYEHIFSNTREVEVRCNLLEISEGNIEKTIDTFVFTPKFDRDHISTFQRFNVRIVNPKYHRMRSNQVKEIKIQIKDRKSGKLLMLKCGEVVATLHFK